MCVCVCFAAGAQRAAVQAGLRLRSGSVHRLGRRGTSLAARSVADRRQKLGVSRRRDVRDGTAALRGTTGAVRSRSAPPRVRSTAGAVCAARWKSGAVENSLAQ